MEKNGWHGGPNRSAQGSDGQILIEAILWTSLLTSLVLALAFGYRSEYRRYRNTLNRGAPALSPPS